MNTNAHHKPIRLGISSLVYHIEVIYRNAGLILASTAPVKNLATINPSKDLHAAVLATIIPQSAISTEMYLATGSVWIKNTPGYSQNK